MPIKKQPVRGTKRIFVASAFYFLLTLIYTYPMVWFWTTAIPAGATGRLDGWQNNWHLWWVAHALSTGQNPYSASLLFAPEGVNLFWHPLNVPLGILLAPATLTAGPLIAYNLAIVLSFVLGGVFQYMLAYRLTQHSFASLVSGACYVLTPSHFTRILDGSLEHASLQWLPLYVYLLLIVTEKGGFWRIAMTALCLVCITLSSWYYGLYAAIFSSIYAVLILIREGWQKALRVVWVGSMMLCILGPFIAPMLAVQPTWRYDYRQAVHSADLMDFILPSPLHPLWGMSWGWRNHDSIGDWNVALGWSVLVLALIGFMYSWKQLWHWFVLLGCSMVLALGPVLIVGGEDTGIPMPYNLLNYLLPSLRIAYRPVYWIVFVVLILSLLVAYGIIILWHKTQTTRVVAVGLLLFAAFELYPGGMPSDQHVPHPFFKRLKAQPREALVELPQSWWSVDAMRDQIDHGWPITGGYLARPGFHEYVVAKQLPGLHQLWGNKSFHQDILEPGQQEQALYALDVAGFRYVVVRHKLCKRGSCSLLLKNLAKLFANHTPVIDDEMLLVYAIPHYAANQPCSVLMELGTGWYEYEEQGAQRWRWINNDATLFLSNYTKQIYQGFLYIEMQAYQGSTPVTVQVDDSRYGTIAVAEKRAYWLPLALAPGHHTVTLYTNNAEPEGTGRYLSVRVSKIMMKPK